MDYNDVLRAMLNKKYIRCFPFKEWLKVQDDYMTLETESGRVVNIPIWQRFLIKTWEMKQ